MQSTSHKSRTSLTVIVPSIVGILVVAFYASFHSSSNHQNRQNHQTHQTTSSLHQATKLKALNTSRNASINQSITEAIKPRTNLSASAPSPPPAWSFEHLESIYAEGKINLLDYMKIKPSFTDVPRLDPNKITFEDFYFNYVLQRKPVIFTNMSRHFFPSWTIPENVEDEGSFLWDEIRRRCYDHPVTIKRFDESNPDARTFAGMVWAGEDTIGHYMDEIERFNMFPDRYLFDQQINDCEALTRDFHIPKFFTNDFFKRANASEFPNVDWYGRMPTAFVGPKGSRGSLHIDSYASHFWQLMLRGTKQWCIYPFQNPESIYLLYARRSNLQNFWHDPFNPDYERFPMTKEADKYRVCFNTHPGDLVFFPGNTPHVARNPFGFTLGFSVNYIDAANVEDALRMIPYPADDDSDQVKAALTEMREFLSSPEKHPPMLRYPKTLPYSEWASYGLRPGEDVAKTIPTHLITSAAPSKHPHA